MTRLLHEACAADMPIAGLAVLAGLRTRSQVTVLARGDRVWVRWPAGEDEVATCLLPVPGAVLFLRRGACWYRVGSRLPTIGLPEETGMALAAALTPGVVDCHPKPTRQLQPVNVTLVRSSEPRPVTAVAADLTELARWAETAPSATFAGLEAAVADGQVVVRGGPNVVRVALAGATRFWGDTLLIPLGWRLEPALPEGDVAEAFGLQQGDSGLLTPDGIEVVAAECFGLLTRAGVRLAGTRLMGGTGGTLGGTIRSSPQE
jgi:hypothetical protein